MARVDILAKIEKSVLPDFSKYFQDILHVKNEEDPVENKKMARSDVLAKLGERKNGQVQATPKTSRCAQCSYIYYIIYHIKRLPEQSCFQIREVFGVSFKTRKVMAKINRDKNVPKPFVLQKPAAIQNNPDIGNNLFV
jgi:hypothetical protein